MVCFNINDKVAVFSLQDEQFKLGTKQVDELCYDVSDNDVILKYRPFPLKFSSDFGRIILQYRGKKKYVDIGFNYRTDTENMMHVFYILGWYFKNVNQVRVDEYFRQITSSSVFSTKLNFTGAGLYIRNAIELLYDKYKHIPHFATSEAFYNVLSIRKYYHFTYNRVDIMGTDSYPLRIIHTPGMNGLYFMQVSSNKNESIFILKLKNISKVTDESELKKYYTDALIDDGRFILPGQISRLISFVKLCRPTARIDKKVRYMCEPLVEGIETRELNEKLLDSVPTRPSDPIYDVHIQRFG